MDVEIRASDLVVLSGPLDFYAARALRDRQIPTVLDIDRGELVIDVTGVAYLSFEGLAALADIRDRVERAGGSIRVVGLEGQPSDLVRLSGLEDVLTSGAAAGPDVVAGAG
jgi:anti-sigma B factor antagonist